MAAWGFHYSEGGNKNGTEEFRERINAAGLPICLKGTASAGLIAEALDSKDPPPHANNVYAYRSTNNDTYQYDTPIYHLPPTEAAQRHYAATVAVWPPELKRDRVWMEAINEPRQADGPDESQPTYNGMLTASWLGYFMIEYAKLAQADGFKVCGPSWASGEPEPEHYSSDGMLAWLSYCAKNPEWAALSVHEYNYASAPYNVNYPWHYGRWQAAIAAADVAGIPRTFPILITEFGWTYQTVPAWEQALPTLNAYNTLCADFPQVKGIALWTLQSGWAGISDLLAGWIKDKGDPMAGWVIGNQVPPPEKPQPTAPEFGPTLPAPPKPAAEMVWSFEEGWTDDPLQPDRRQIPNGFTLQVVPAGKPLWDYGFLASGEVECMHRLNEQFPPDEQLGGAKALILDGNTCFKIQAVSMATGTALSRAVTGTGYKRVTVPINCHYHEPAPYDREPPLASDDVVASLLIDGVEVDRLEFPDLVDRKWLNLTAVAMAPFTVTLRFQNSYANSRDLFTDAWQIGPADNEDGEIMAFINLGRTSTEKRAGATHARLAFFRTEKIEGGQKRVWVGETDLVEIPGDVTEVNAVQYVEEPKPPPDPSPPQAVIIQRGGLGVDVSAWQEAFDWETAQANGVQFAIIRSSNGLGSGTTDADGRDKQLIRNVTECYRLDIPFALYHFLRADNDIAGQVALVHDILAELDLAQISPLPFAMPNGYVLPPVWIDAEHTSLTNEQIKAFYDGLNVAAGIYTGKSVWDGIMAGVTPWWSNVPLWVAAYGANDGKLPPWTAPFRPAGWESIAIWQYTSQGQNTVGLPGLGGLDLNSMGPYPDSGVKPPEPVDMTQYYLPPEGRAHGDISIKSTNWGQGDIRQQLQVHDGYLFVTKGGEIEKRQIVGDLIYLLLDDSPGDGKYYIVSSDTGWIPTQFGVGQTFTRQEEVTFYFKDSCEPTGEDISWTNEMLFKAFYPQWTSPHGVTLGNVAHLQWILNGTVQEDYYLAPGLGYAGWKNIAGRESWIKELIPYTDQQPNKFSGGCYHAPLG